MTETRTPEQALAWKSVKWRNTAGWVVVAVIAWRYLAQPITSAFLVSLGHEPLPPLESLDLADTAALVGLPIGGSVADRMSGDT